MSDPIVCPNCGQADRLKHLSEHRWHDGPHPDPEESEFCDRCSLWICAVPVVPSEGPAPVPEEEPRKRRKKG